MEVLTSVDDGRIEALLARDEFFWLDLRDAPGDAVERAGALLGLHPLALEDSREFAQRPKLDRYPQAVLLVYWSARITANRLAVEPVEVHLHISGGFLLTVRRAPCPEIEALHAELPEENGSEDYVVYRVLDALTDALFPVIDHLEVRIDALEAEVLHDPRQPQIDDLGALTATFFNANATRLNRLATRLTVMATFFLIWTLVTSFFGQNFRWLTDHIASFEAFVLYESVTLVIPTILAAGYFW